jgi:hypothetical protein
LSLIAGAHNLAISSCSSSALYMVDCMLYRWFNNLGVFYS